MTDSPSLSCCDPPAHPGRARQTASALRTTILLALGLTLTGEIHASRPLQVVDRGASRYVIVLPAQSSPSEQYAAEELQSYLEKISGARLPIVPDTAPGSKREIWLGNNARLQSSGLQIDWERVGSDGFHLQTHGHHLVIAGGTPRGTLYGVYTLLEEKLGVRWFTPELESVPRTNRVWLPALDELKVPALENREVFWTEIMRNADFAARHRLNGQHYALQAKHGGRFAVYFPFVHSFEDLIPRNLYQEHPDYFPLIDGKRVDGYVQRCLSHPEVLKLAIATVRRWIREHPEADIISVSQNDTGKWCQCPECKALDDAEGSPAATMLRFVNAIAADIEADHPKVRIDTLAYQYTRKPPRTLRPRHNVIVRLCSIECCFAHPLAECDSEDNRRFREDVAAWQPVAPLLYVWDYTPNFAHYQQPFPNFDSLQKNVKFFIDHGVKGLFEQGNYSPGGYGELGPLRAYVLAKLLWNPDSDPRLHAREFCEAYYGQAAPGILALIDLMQQQVRGRPIHARIFDSPRSAYLNEGFLQQADRLLADAEAAAEDADRRFRVRLARVPVWYVKLATDRVKGAERMALLEDLLAVCRKAGVSHISESQSLDDWAKKQAARE